MQRQGLRHAVRPLALFLCVLPFLVACSAGGATQTVPPPAVTAPVVTPAPTPPPTATLAERLRLRAYAPGALALFLQPDDGRAPVLDAFNNAQASIDLMIYLLTDREVIAALKNAVLRGVAVRVLLEPVPCCAESNTMQRAIYSELQEARVQVQWSNPAFRLTHAKMAVIDGTAALIMTQNLTKSAFTANREASIIDRDPADVNALQSLFDADWARGTYTPTNPNLVIANANARAKLLALINGATKTLMIESEEMQDTAIVDALLAAQKRGVTVRYVGTAPRIVTNGPAQPDNNAPARKRLVAGGVGVRVLAAPYVHTKTVVADGQVAFVGSENFTAASLDTNREIGLLTTDGTVMGRLTGVFTKDWAAAKPDV